MNRHLRRDDITDALAGRQAGLIKASLDRLVDQLELDDLSIYAHAVEQARCVTDAAWQPPATDTQEGEDIP